MWTWRLHHPPPLSLAVDINVWKDYETSCQKHESRGWEWDGAIWFLGILIPMHKTIRVSFCYQNPDYFCVSKPHINYFHIFVKNLKVFIIIINKLNVSTYAYCKNCIHIYYKKGTTTASTMLRIKKRSHRVCVRSIWHLCIRYVDMQEPEVAHMT